LIENKTLGELRKTECTKCWRLDDGYGRNTLGVCMGPWGGVINFYDGKGRRIFLYMENNNLRGNYGGCCVIVIFI